MKYILLLLFCVTTYSQNYVYPGQLEIRKFKIGDHVDKKQFTKLEDLYFPNYLDGGTMQNTAELPEKYEGLPIAMWQLKNDENIVLTLLDNVILNIVVSNIEDKERKEIIEMITKKFGGEGKNNSYQETHPLQSYITFWNLYTWETKDVIFQIGTSIMRSPNESIPNDLKSNLVYSDFILEKQIIDTYKKH